MLREDIETRIGRLLERARAENAETFANAPAAAALAVMVEQRIDASIEWLITEPPMRAPVRERPALAERWPLCVSTAKPDSDEARTLLRLWQIDSGRRDALNDKTAIEAILTEAYALLASIEHQVTEDRRRAAMAIDAGHPHHSLVSGMRDMPKDGIRKRGAKGQLAVEDGYVEVLAPGHGSAQLHFPLGCLNETVLETLREWRGSKGLRHWAAMQRLLSIEGERRGRVVWKLDEHLEGLGYSEKTRRDHGVRTSVAQEVELLTKMELGVYDGNGKLRLRKAIFTVLTKGDRLIEETGTWALEGLELEIHPLIYEGVRDPETGRLGKNWFPQIIEVAKIDDVRFSAAITLGLMLPMRWRWAIGEGRDHCALSGGSLLNAAGIKYNRRQSVGVWRALRRSLDELQRIGALGRYSWHDGEAWSLGAICRLFPPQWAVDRVIHRLPPIVVKAANVAANGKDLRDWRQSRDWTQAKLAEALSVTERTVRRAEATPEVALGPVVTKRLKDFVEMEATAKRATMVSSPSFVEI